MSHPPQSCGILLFRRSGDSIEVLLGHPGGPYWRGQDLGSWSVPKGIAEPDESLAVAAAREFAEETGFQVVSIALDPGQPPIDLREVSLKSGKVIRAWAIEGDLDPALSVSNEIEIEWPPRSGRRLRIPELDRVAWFAVAEAGERIHPGQRPFIGRLEQRLRSPGTG